MPYAPELGFSASYIQPLSLFHRSSRQVHWVFWLKPNAGSMLYPMLCAVPGSGGCAAPVVTLVELDEEFAAALCEAMTCEGFVIAGFDATVRVRTALSMTMRFLRSCTINATEPLCGSESMTSARLLAPLPFGLITLAATATTATRITATKNAGSTIPLRRRLRCELRDLLAEVHDSVVVPVEAGIVFSSIAVPFRDNAVPSVFVSCLGHHCRSTMPEREFTCPQLGRNQLE